MATINPQDPCVFRDSSNKDFPAVVIATYDAGTNVSVLTAEDPPKTYGPNVAGFPSTENDSKIPVVSSPGSYSVIATLADQQLAASSAAAAGAAGLAGELAADSFRPWGIHTGVDPATSWTFDGVRGIWERRFANQTINFYRGQLSAKIETIFAWVQDFADPGGKILMTAAWAPINSMPKVFTLDTANVSSQGNGFTQLISFSPEDQPSGVQSELRLSFTTGTANAPAGGPFYEMYQTYYTVISV